MLLRNGEDDGRDLNEVLRLHKMFVEGVSGGTRANLRDADLRSADLTYANLRDANLDFSAFPLWCGGTRFKADDRLVAQVLAHLCSLDVSPEARRELNKILAFAKTSHRAQECGIADAVVPPTILSQEMLRSVWHDGCVNGAGTTPDFNALIEPFGYAVSKEAS